MTAPWRNCAASLVLVGEINARWPNRDRGSDGTIGDAAHAARTSDHNPWMKVDDDDDGIPETGVVRARDIDKDGIDAAALAEYLRGLGARRDGRLWPGGYVIFNRRITTPDFAGWHEYTGTNPHTAHVHVSFTTTPGTAGFDSIAPWGIAAAAEEDDMFTDQDRALLTRVATALERVPIDIGFARDQILANYGVIETERAPSRVTPDQAAQIAPARRTDVAYWNDQHVRAVGALQQQVSALTVQISSLVRALTPPTLVVGGAPANPSTTPPKGPQS